MATKKELVEAQAFSRRRLLTAFTSGAPGGRELEPAKPMRGVIAGVVLSALVVGGSLVVGLLNRGLPDGWDDGAIILVRENAARYVTDDGVLLPVENMASARLVAPQHAPMYTVSASDLEDVPRGERFGIVGAPDSLPAPAGLVASGWRSCVAPDGALRTSLLGQGSAGDGDADAADDAGDAAAAGGSGEDAEAGTLVRAGDRLVLVQGGLRFPVPETDELGGVLRALGLDETSAIRVDPRWLQLFGEGADIAPFTVPGAGDPATGPAAEIPGAVVGSLIVVTGTDDGFVLDRDGRLAPLTPLARELYVVGPGGDAPPIEVSSNDVSSLRSVPPEESPVPASWPAEAPEPIGEDASPCAHLETRGEWSTTLVAGPAVENGGVEMAPGAGALGRFVADPDTTSGPIRFVDENGTMYAITGADPVAALARLGYSTDDVVTVPYAWGDLFPAGPNLSIEAAERSETVIPGSAEDVADGEDASSGDDG